LQKAVQALSAFYIADGHHRAASFSRIATQKGNSLQFSVAIFSEAELQILPFYRLVSAKETVAVPNLLEAMHAVPCAFIPPNALQHGEALVLSKIGCWKINLNPNEAIGSVALQQEILEPLFGITDPQRDTRIDFIPASEEVEKVQSLLANGQFDLAFLPSPVSVRHVMDIADAHAIMPPKSTCFEPKVASGIVIQQLAL